MNLLEKEPIPSYVHDPALQVLRYLLQAAVYIPHLYSPHSEVACWFPAAAPD